MLLKQIYLYPDLVEYGDDMIHPFRDQSRSVCNFLERSLGSEKFLTPNFKKVCFVGTSQASDEVVVNASGALIVKVVLDEAAYKKCASPNELNAFFTDMLLEGLEKSARQAVLPHALLKSALDEFRRNDYQNEWTFKSKKIRHSDYTCALECRLTTDCFLMYFKVLKSNAPVLATEILRTAPDEVVFRPYLKDIKEENGRISVIDKSGLAFYTTTVARLDKQSDSRRGQQEF